MDFEHVGDAGGLFVPPACSWSTAPIVTSTTGQAQLSLPVGPRYCGIANFGALPDHCPFVHAPGGSVVTP